VFLALVAFVIAPDSPGTVGDSPSHFQPQATAKGSNQSVDCQMVVVCPSFQGAESLQTMNLSSTEAKIKLFKLYT